tara:strand:+ start:476 stop:1159 length:684 start_codon:yes stop_codon:yes gene_type:complete
MTKTTTNNMSSSRKSAKALKNLSDILLENTKDAKDAKNIYNSLEKSEIVNMLETQENLNELLLSMGKEFDRWLNNVDGEWVFTTNSYSNFYIISPEANNIDKWCKDKYACLSNLNNILNDLFKDKSELREFITSLYENIVKNNKKKLGEAVDNLGKANDSFGNMLRCIDVARGDPEKMKMCTRQSGASKSKKRKKSKRRRKSKKRHKKRRKFKKRRKSKKRRKTKKK